MEERKSCFCGIIRTPCALDQDFHTGLPAILATSILTRASPLLILFLHIKLLQDLMLAEQPAKRVIGGLCPTITLYCSRELRSCLRLPLIRSSKSREAASRVVMLANRPRMSATRLSV